MEALSVKSNGVSRLAQALSRARIAEALLKGLKGGTKLAYASNRPTGGPELAQGLLQQPVQARNRSIGNMVSVRVPNPCWLSDAIFQSQLPTFTCRDTKPREIFSCDQAALWMVQSVRPSVRPSVRLSVRPSVTPFWLCSYQRIIMKFSGVITKDKSDVHAKDGGQRSKVKVTEVTTQLNRFRTVTPVWIHIWWWNDAYSLMMLRRGALLFLKVIRRISRSHGSKKRRIWPRLGVSGL